MKLILDTNCYVSYLNRRNEKQHEAITDLIEAVSRAEYEVLMTGHNMSETVFVLQSVYGLQSSVIHQILNALLANPGFEFIHGHYPEPLLNLWPSEIKDYGDALLASAASVLEAKICTFDQPFKRSLRKLGLLADLL